MREWGLIRVRRAEGGRDSNGEDRWFADTEGFSEERADIAARERVGNEGGRKKFCDGE